MDRRSMGFLAFLLLLAGGCGNGEKELAEARKFGASAYDYYMKASEAGNVRATLRLAYEYQSEAPILFKPADRVELGKDRTAEMVQLLWRAGAQDFERTLQFLSAFKAFKWMEGAAMGAEVETALRLWRSAEKGDARAQCSLGECYAKGKGVGQSWTEAARWYRASAEQRNAAARYNLGECYAKGKGVEQSWTEAVKLYRASAEQGNAAARCNLGECYAKGKGVEQSWTKAVKLYRVSAEQGDARAQFNLGLCYGKGRGVEQSWTEAVRWFHKSAKQGNARGQYCLGCCYRHGEGIVQDVTRAKALYRQAAQNGFVLDDDDRAFANEN